MPNEVAARQYGRAYYDTAVQEGSFEPGLKQLEELTLLLSASEVRRAWYFPQITNEVKLGMVSELLGGELLPLNKRFVALLLDKKRSDLLPVIIDQLYKIHRQEQGVLVAELASAEPLETEAEQRLVAKLERQYGQKIELKKIVDPTLLGGFSYRVGDTVLDGTLKRRLQRMREYLLPQFRV